MINIDEHFSHPIKNKDDEEPSKAIKSFQEQEQRDRAEIKLHIQSIYLMAKVRKEGKLYNVSSGVKVPRGLIWNLKPQRFEEVKFFF